MTLLRVEAIDARAEGKLRGKATRTQYVFECNGCGVEFVKSGVKRKYLDRSTHYCTLACVNSLQKSGALRAIDFADPNNVEKGAAKAKQAVWDKYGARGVFGVPEFAAKARRTMLERYGDEFPQRLDETKSKMKATNVDRYGHEFPLHGSLKEEVEARNLEKWGTKHPGAALAVIEKREATVLERYGVTSFVETGIPSMVAATPESQAKRFETLKKRGLLKRSNKERAVFTLLVDVFGANNVEHSVTVNGWSLDAFIKPASTYVQFDGVYWHALNRPIDEVRASASPMDRALAKKYDRDRAADAWFAAHNNLRLIRVTELEWDEADDKRAFLLGLLELETR